MQRTAATTPAPSPSLPVPRPLLSAALCAALMGAAAWAVVAAGWAQNTGGAMVVAVAAAVEAALLARAAVPRWVSLLLVPVLALAAIVPTTIGSMPFDGDASVSHTIGRYAAALASGLGASSDWPFTVGLSAVLWLCGFWVGFLAMRERRGVLAVLPVYAVLATNVLNARNPDTLAVPVAVAVCFSLLVVADSHLDALQLRADRRNVLWLPRTRASFAASAGVMAVLLTVAALVLPPISNTDISSRFFPGASGNGHAGRATALVPSGAGTIQFSGVTQPGGPLVSHPQPVLSYTIDSTVPLYLSVVADTRFFAGNWYPGRAGDAQDPVNFDGVAFSGGSLPRDPSLADGVRGKAVRTVHTQIVLQANATGDTPYTPFAGEPLSIDQAGIAFGQATANGLLTVDSVELNSSIISGTTVNTTGTVSTASVAELRSAGSAYPDWVRPYRMLEDDFTNGAQVITQLAQQWTAGITNPYDQATAIEAHFRNPSFFQYTLNPPDVPPKTWPIVYFLTTSHRGYCQYFAASMGAMLRSLGIPTRLVNGFGSGTTQAISGRPGIRQQVVTTSDAHTWVEAFFPGYGWIPFEPTPPSSDGNYVPFQRGNPSASSANAVPPPAAGDTKPGFNDPAFNPALRPVPATKPAPPPWMQLAIAGGVLLSLPVLFVIWLLLPRSTQGAWRRIEVLGAVWGMRRKPSETYREYARRFTVAPAIDGRLNEVAALMGRAHFSGQGIDTPTSRRVKAMVRGAILAALPATLRERSARRLNQRGMTDQSSPR
jgi:transglutaminase-like putative cysteine protease